MEIIHEVTLSQYAAKSVGGALKLGTRDSYGAEKIHVTRDETWAGLTITATFRIGGTAVRTPLDGQDRMDVPQEATSEAGRGTIVFVGTDGEQQIITKNLNYSVDDHDDAGGDAPNPTPDVWTQFVAQTKDNADRAELSADSANAAAAAAGQDADSAQRDARTAQQQAAAAAVLAGQVQQAAGQVQTDRTAAQAAAEQAGSSAAAVEESAAQAAEHRTAAEAAAQAAEDSAEAAESSATAAGGSAADAASSASAAAQAAENAAQSEANTADSAEAASSSAAAAADSKEAAAISEGRAAGSAKISESWAVGGTGIRAGEDTNNARYWAQLAQTVAQGAQGYFVTADALKAAHPTGQDGWWAIVGATDTIWIWDSDTGAWVDSSTSIDLSNYYTKQESDGRYATAAQGAKADTAVQTVNGKTGPTVTLTHADVSAQQEPLIGSIEDITPRQVCEALAAGRQCFIDSDGLVFANWVYINETDAGYVCATETLCTDGQVEIHTITSTFLEGENGSWDDETAFGYFVEPLVKQRSNEFLTIDGSGGQPVLERVTPDLIGAATKSQGEMAETAVQEVNGKTGESIMLDAGDVGAAEEPLVGTTTGISTADAISAVKSGRPLSLTAQVNGTTVVSNSGFVVNAGQEVFLSREFDLSGRKMIIYTNYGTASSAILTNVDEAYLVPYADAGDSYLLASRNGTPGWERLVNIIYPVGSIYMSVNDASPAALFGGTWERIQDKILLAAGEQYDAGTYLTVWGGDKTSFPTLLGVYIWKRTG